MRFKINRGQSNLYTNTGTFYFFKIGGTLLRKPKGSAMKAPPTCWSEVSSPRKQVRISVAMAEEIAATHEEHTANVMATATEIHLPGQARQTSSSLLIEHEPNDPHFGSTNTVIDSTQPIVAAIKEELQKFHRPRSPNHGGISVIEDPELLQHDGNSVD